jgi:prevent-host-death family protein
VVTFPRYRDHVDVPIRELKAHLSAILERVQAGEVVGITNRGRRVARILPEAGAQTIERGVAEGWIRPPSGEPPAPVVRVAPRPGSLETVEAIRRDRDE